MSVERYQVLPVIIGGDIGVYAIGRSFHEAFGVSSVAVSNAPADLIVKSSIFSVEYIPSGISDAELLAVLRGLAASYSQRTLVLMANSDMHSGFIARNYEALSQHYILPFPTVDVVEKVTDKAVFARIAEGLGIPTPGTVTVDLRGVDLETWKSPTIPFDFPVVAKAAVGDDYDRVTFEGKRKIWFLESQEELDQMWKMLIEAGFVGDFLVQELIPGDNTYMRSLTAYVDSHGDITLLGTARVLLEDHDPAMIGNPVAMITEPFEELWEDASRFLKETGYRGFANFDIKVDPRDGRAVFFEINPRIGRNNWYMTAAGHNPMSVMVADLVDHERVEPQRVYNEVLYSLVPDSLLLRYIRDEELLTRVKSIIADGRRMNPIEYSAEKSLIRRFIVALQKVNHYRKFARYYPEPTDRSF